MKQVFLLLSLLFIAGSATAQFGLTVRNNWNDASDWLINEPNIENELLGDGFAFGIDYWFRLKNVRVEFLPELNYAQYETDFIENSNFSVATYSFFFNTNFYLFDFAGDCDCPTFSKQGPSLQKGFFLQLTPGISYFTFDNTVQQAVSSSNELAFSIAGAVGIDFGLSDLVTLTPMVGLRYYATVNWEDLERHLSASTDFVGEAESDISQLFAGIRLGIRLDNGY